MSKPTNNNVSIAKYMAHETIQANIQQVLKDKAPQFMASVASLVNTNDGLKQCDPGSVLRACLTAASLDLPINQSLGFAYVIPYNQKGGKAQAQFQMGYKGFVQLAMRSGQFKTINVTDIREGEMKRRNQLTGEIEFEWLIDGREDAEIVGYAAYMRLINGFEKTLFLSVEELKKHGVKFSKSFAKGYGLWKDDFDAMAKKTTVKMLLSKYAPMTVDMQTAQLADQAVVQTDDYEYVDNESPTIDEVNNSKEDERVLRHIESSKTLDELEQCAEAVSEATRAAYDDKHAELSGEKGDE